MTIARVALPVATRTAFDYWVPEGPAGRRAARSCACASRAARSSAWSSTCATTPTSRASGCSRSTRSSRCRRCPPTCSRSPSSSPTTTRSRSGEALALAVPPPGQRTRRLRALADAGRGARADARCPTRRSRRRSTRSSPRAATFAPFLLQGVTGSGKTDVYLGAAAARDRGRRPGADARAGDQPHAAVRGARARGAARRVVPSRCTAASPTARGARTGSPRRTAKRDLVLGTRLAVFCPLPRLALVVVDEEHDASYKQQDGVRYHARDVAVWRAHARGVPIVLGSATPSLESYAQARGGTLSAARAAASAPIRARRCRDSRSSPTATRARTTASPARCGTRSRACLARGEQSLVFVNRRGFAPSLKCASCAWEAAVPALQRAAHAASRARDAALPSLRSRRARAARRARRAATSTSLPLGFGTQRLERALADAFPARAHRARRPRQHARARRVRRRCARGIEARRGRHPGRHADAREGPRLSAAHAGGRARRRQRALQRRLPRDRAARSRC